MSGLHVLDVVIGLAFVYLTLALVASAVVELLADIGKLRARNLGAAIGRMLFDDRVKRDLLGHALVKSFMRADPVDSDSHSHLPSYLPSRAFALSLLDVIASKAPKDPAPPAAVPAALVPAVPAPPDGSLLAAAPAAAVPAAGASATTPSGASSTVALMDGVQRAIAAGRAGEGKALPKELASVLHLLLLGKEHDLAAALDAIQRWFDETMERWASVHRRWARTRLWIVGITLALALNADTFVMAKKLQDDPVLRAGIVEKAGEAVAAPAPANPNPAAAPGSTPTADGIDLSKRAQAIRDALAPIEPLIGWSDEAWDRLFEPKSFLSQLAAILGKLLGCVVTGIACALGAPFWFDLVGKLVSLRTSTKPVAAKGAAGANGTK